MESGAPKRKRMSNEMESESLPSPKHVNLGKSELQMSNGNDYPVQHREAAATVVRSVVLASVKSDDDVSSSQETVYSYTEEQNVSIIIGPVYMESLGFIRKSYVINIL